MPPARDTAAARAAIALVALVIAGVALATLHALDPGAGPLEQPLSAYGRGPHVWLWRLTLGAAASAALVLGWRGAPGDAGPARGTALSIGGLSFLALAWFPGDAWFPWERAPSGGGVLHGLATAAAVVAFGVAMLGRGPATGATRGPTRGPAGDRLLRALGIAYVAVGVGAAAVVAALQRATGHAPFFGAAERLMVAVLALWLAVCARRLRAGARARARADTDGASGTLGTT